MKPHVQGSTGRNLFWPLSALTLSLFAFVLMILTGAANAAPMPVGADVPLAVPTVPATVGSASPTPHGTPSTAVPTATSRPVISTTPTVPGPLPTGQPTVIPCGMHFTDVLPSDWFYQPVDWMYCNHILTGYPDNTFRPNNNTTRGQLLKIAMGAFGLPPHTPGGPHFADVAQDNTFYNYVETAFFYSIVNGYPCGGPGEPCDQANRPYFRPNTPVTRSQSTKITVLSGVQTNPDGWHLLNPPLATFVDVAPDDIFYVYVETAVAHNILQGYPCGDPGEPCPGRYFRPLNNSTRAQLSKMVYLAVTQP